MYVGVGCFVDRLRFLLQGMGHKEESGSVEVENRRRTRSSTRGVPPTPPPPAKREKKTPPSGGRGE